MPYPCYLSEELHLNLSGKVLDSFEGININLNDSVNMVFELCFDLLISYLWDDLSLLKVVHILSV